MTQDTYIETEVGRIYYWKTPGDTAKPTLVFLHGLSSNHLTWDSIVQQAEQSGYATLSLDLRGHGLSDKSRKRTLYTIPTMRRDLELVIEKERLTNFVLVGYSYGAYITLDYLRTHPDVAQGAMLISTNFVSPLAYHWFSFLSPLVYSAINLFGWTLLWQKRANYYYFEPEKAHGYWHSTFSGYATMPLSINFWMLSEVFMLNLRKGLERVMSPVLIIRGDNDAFITEKEMNDLSQLIPNSRVVTLGLGHYVAAHYQERCGQELLNFTTTLI